MTATMPETTATRQAAPAECRVVDQNVHPDAVQVGDLMLTDGYLASVLDIQSAGAPHAEAGLFITVEHAALGLTPVVRWVGTGHLVSVRRYQEAEPDSDWQQLTDWLASNQDQDRREARQAIRDDRPTHAAQMRHRADAFREVLQRMTKIAKES